MLTGSAECHGVTVLWDCHAVRGVTLLNAHEGCLRPEGEIGLGWAKLRPGPRQNRVGENSEKERAWRPPFTTGAWDGPLYWKWCHSAFTRVSHKLGKSPNYSPGDPRPPLSPFMLSLSFSLSWTSTSPAQATNSFWRVLASAIHGLREPQRLWSLYPESSGSSSQQEKASSPVPWDSPLSGLLLQLYYFLYYCCYCYVNCVFVYVGGSQPS